MCRKIEGGARGWTDWTRDVAEKDHEASALGPQKHMQLTFNRANPIAGRMASTRVDEQESWQGARCMRAIKGR